MEWCTKIHKYIVQSIPIYNCTYVKVSTPKQRSARLTGMINEINKSAFVRIIGQPPVLSLPPLSACIMHTRAPR